MRCLLPLFLLACNPEIREAERRQKALQSQIEDLQGEIAVLKKRMTEAGVPVEPGRRANKRRTPKPQARVVLPPTHDHTADLRPTIERHGPLPAIRMPSFERTRAPCGYRILLPDLRRISDFQLTQRGFGKASPLRMRLKNTPLKPHAFPKDFDHCSGSFRHAGTVVLFAPTNKKIKPDDFVLHYDERFPSPRADARPLYWLHPGQTVTLTTNAPWLPAWGPPELSMVVDAITPPTVLLDGKPIQPGAAITTPGPWSFILTAQDHTLIDVLQVGNTEHGFTITSPAIWRKKP